MLVQPVRHQTADDVLRPPRFRLDVANPRVGDVPVVDHLVVVELADASRGTEAPATISVLSGDIHFSFASEVRFPQERRTTSRVHQLVSSPIRNALKGPERTAMRLGTSTFARALGRVLRRSVGCRRPQPSWRIDLGPVFANTIGQLTFEGSAARLLVLQARPHDDSASPAFDEVFEFDLVAGSRASAVKRRR